MFKLSPLKKAEMGATDPSDNMVFFCCFLNMAEKWQESPPAAIAGRAGVRTACSGWFHGHGVAPAQVMATGRAAETPGP